MDFIGTGLQSHQKHKGPQGVQAQGRNVSQEVRETTVTQEKAEGNTTNSTSSSFTVHLGSMRQINAMINKSTRPRKAYIYTDNEARSETGVGN